MANEKIQLRIGADTKDMEAAFDQAIRKIQGEINKIKAPATIIQAQQTTAAKATQAGLPMSAPSMEAYRRANDAANVQLKQRAVEEQQSLERINRILERRKAVIDELKKQQEATIKGSKEEAEIKERLFRAEERERQSKENFVRRYASFNTLINAQPKGQSPVNLSKMSRSGITSISDLLSALGPEGQAALGIGFTAVAGTKIIEKLRRTVSESGIRARETEASAFQMQGQGGQRLQSILGGNVMPELQFNQQRQQAAAYASKAINARYSAYRPLVSLNALLGKEAAGAFEHGQFGQGFLALGGRFSPSMHREFESNKANEQTTMQSSQFNALLTGPGGALRTFLTKQYNENAMRDLAFQRATGLNMGSFRGTMGPNGEARGGFIQNITNAGFTQEQGMQSALGILGAGGSTRAAQGSASTALQAGRAFNLTNASQILGNISSTLGSSGASNEAFIRLLAEGMRLGLNKSDFAAENRKFMSMASQMVVQAGASSGADIGQLMSQYGRFFGGDKTMTGLQAGQGAFDLYRQMSMTTTGPVGTMRAAGMVASPIVGKLGRFSRAALFNMPVDQLVPSNPAIIAMAKEASTPGHIVTPQQLIDEQNRITGVSANKYQETDLAIKHLTEVKKKYGLSSAVNLPKMLSTGARQEIKTALGRAMTLEQVEHPELGQNFRTSQQYTEALSTGNIAQAEKLRAQLSTQMAGTATGRPEDEMVRIQAEASKLANQLFMNIKDSIVPASDAAKEFKTQIDALKASMHGKTPEEQGNLWTNFLTGIGIIHQPAPSASVPTSGSH